ncbi:MAG TPA: AraC family transcriptional regulator [Gammaproteobacteria bacterium]|jgi:transcriptional regulator GlxA family with amidase domain|nr:AraC family transcriptional regulator [Gammaproteobacteria bacterium]
MAPSNPGSRLKNCGFLLVEHFSLIAFAAAVEPLRVANRLLGENYYAWQTLSLDGHPVNASNGIAVAGVEASQAGPFDTVFVCGGLHAQAASLTALTQYLQQLDSIDTQLGSLSSGAYLLAQAGLLDDYRASIHWEHLTSAREQFPRVHFSSDLFERDGNRVTCSGGTAPIDMMLTLISEDHGMALSCQICESLICERMRSERDRQRTPLRMHLGTSQPKLTEAVTLMEANLEEPISLDELSGYVGISRRQLERLFRKHLDCVPMRYYLELRLNRARHLLLHTDKAIIDVAKACGFVSSPHFSKCYRDYFGLPPRDERRRHLSARDQAANAPAVRA